MFQLGYLGCMIFGAIACELAHYVFDESKERRR